MRVPFARVDCAGNERDYLERVLDSGWLTSASMVRSLEERLADYLGVRHAIAVSSCTAALHLALEALGVGAGDRVFVPTFTFTASAEVLRYLGADPVFLDVDPDTASLSPSIVAAAIARHPDVRTLVGVHYGGRAMPMADRPGGGILALCEAAGLRVVEDAAHALPSRDRGRLVGTFGAATCFSFYANKTMTSGEGGLVTTDDDTLAERMRLMRLHGMTRDIWNRSGEDRGGWEYDIVAPGFKYNLSDLAAAVGLAQFERLEAMRARRQAIAARYLEAFADLDALALPPTDLAPEEHAWHLFPIRLRRSDETGRADFIEALRTRGIGTSVHYKPLHRMSYYRERYALAPADFPNAERLWRSIVSLPIYSALGDEEVGYVIDAVRELLGAARACSADEPGAGRRAPPRAVRGGPG